jgi:hypothetical protein
MADRLFGVASEILGGLTAPRTRSTRKKKKKPETPEDDPPSKAEEWMKLRESGHPAGVAARVIGDSPSTGADALWRARGRGCKGPVESRARARAEGEGGASRSARTRTHPELRRDALGAGFILAVAVAAVPYRTTVVAAEEAAAAIRRLLGADTKILAGSGAKQS